MKGAAKSNQYAHENQHPGTDSVVPVTSSKGKNMVNHALCFRSTLGRMSQAAGPVNPSTRPVRHQLHDGAGDVQRTGPLLKVRVNLPADFQHRGVSAEAGGNVVQFRISLGESVKLAPALSGLKVEAVGRLKRFHRLTGI